MHAPFMSRYHTKQHYEIRFYFWKRSVGNEAVDEAKHRQHDQKEIYTLMYFQILYQSNVSDMRDYHGIQFDTASRMYSKYISRSTATTTTGYDSNSADILSILISFCCAWSRYSTCSFTRHSSCCLTSTFRIHNCSRHS